jgi:hypothetical protein
MCFSYGDRELQDGFAAAFRAETLQTGCIEGLGRRASGYGGGTFR